MNEEAILAMRFDDLEDSDILRLTDAEIQEVIDFRCAQEGIKLPKELPPRPEDSIDKELERETLFQVKHGGHDIILLADRADAEKVVKFLTGMTPIGTDYDYKLGYKYKYAQPIDGDFSIENKVLYKLEPLTRFSETLTLHKKKREEYDAVKSFNDKVASQKEKISDVVWNRVQAARAEAQRVAEYNATFEEYVKVAKGDREMAMTFMLKAYGDDLPDGWSPEENQEIEEA